MDEVGGLGLESKPKPKALPDAAIVVGKGALSPCGILFWDWWVVCLWGWK